ncbi:MAG: hypothetical protein WDO56_36015 [Gammaproteobacteria bacterium]
MNDQSPIAIDSNETDVAADLDDDYEDFKKFLAEEDEPLPSMATAGLPGGGIAFSTRGYATAEEADAAHEAFLRKVWEVPDEDD